MWRFVLISSYFSVASVSSCTIVSNNSASSPRFASLRSVHFSGTLIIFPNACMSALFMSAIGTGSRVGVLQVVSLAFCMLLMLLWHFSVCVPADLSAVLLLRLIHAWVRSLSPNWRRMQKVIQTAGKASQLAS